MFYSQEQIGDHDELQQHGIHAITTRTKLRRVKAPSGFVEHGEGEGDVRDQMECTMQRVWDALSERP